MSKLIDNRPRNIKLTAMAKLSLLVIMWVIVLAIVKVSPVLGINLMISNIAFVVTLLVGITELHNLIRGKSNIRKH